MNVVKSMVQTASKQYFHQNHFNIRTILFKLSSKTDFNDIPNWQIIQLIHICCCLLGFLISFHAQYTDKTLFYNCI